jgi:hypothetical protein
MKDLPIVPLLAFLCRCCAAERNRVEDVVADVAARVSRGVTTAFLGTAHVKSVRVTTTAMALRRFGIDNEDYQ